MKLTIPFPLIQISLVVTGIFLIISNTHSQTIDIEDQLVLRMPIEGNAVDMSGNNTPTTVDGPVLTADRFGNNNSAYKFDGKDDYINLNNDAPVITALDFTIAIWVKVDGPSQTTSNSLFQQRHKEADPAFAKSVIHFSAEVAGKAYLAVRTSEHSNQPSAKLACNYLEYNKWHHYVALKEGFETRIYIDGQPCSSVYSDEPGDLTTNIDFVDLGLHKYYNGEIKGSLNGCIDDVHIFNRALNECEILYLYAGSLPDER